MRVQRVADRGDALVTDVGALEVCKSDERVGLQHRRERTRALPANLDLAQVERRERHLAFDRLLEDGGQLLARRHRLAV